MAPELVGDPLAGHPKYERVRDLNSGAFGAVVLARNRATGRQVAVKLLPRGEKIGRVREGREGEGDRTAHFHVSTHADPPLLLPTHSLSTSSASSSTTPTSATPTSSSSRKRS